MVQLGEIGCSKPYLAIVGGCADSVALGPKLFPIVIGSGRDNPRASQQNILHHVGGVPDVPDGLKRRPASRLNVSRMWCLEQQRLSLLGKALLHHMQAAAVAPSSDYEI